MRIDKYLKVSRVIKRRTVAKEVADHERILVNDRSVKASYQVKIGDIITIEFGNKIIKIRVLSLQESTKKADAFEMFELLSEERRPQSI